jgi:ABC-type lipoprotein export system ATPase subunit
VITVADLEFRYGEEFRLRIPELHVPGGTSAAFIGPSGSGKTTLLHLLAGIITPAAGRIEIEGADLTALDDRGRRDLRIRRLGLVFQEFELIEHLNVLDNILLPYRIHPALRLDAAVRDRAVRLARDVGIDDKLRRTPERLSQGEKQRAAICRALLPEPAILLADEPTGNLDPASTEHVLDILFDYTRSRAATLVTVTHDHDLLGRFERVVDFRDFFRNFGKP